MSKCLNCNADLSKTNNDFYCCLACAIQGFKADSKKLFDAIGKELPDNFPDAEDMQFARDCMQEKHDQQYLDNPSL